MQRSIFYFPGFVKKSVSFTIDDGNIPMDTKFLSIVNPGGIRGTFNLCANRLTEDPAFYRELYRGHEIANHCNYHPYPFLDGVSYELAEEPFDPETADKGKIYRSEKPALYHVTNRLGAWRLAAKTEDYLRFVREGREGLERIFGAGSVQGFAWPYGRQANAEIEKYLRAHYRHVRAVRDMNPSYAMPRDRGAWCCNAWDGCVCERAAVYEAMPDGGELRFFCIGVHSVDYERSGNWGDLEEFVRRFGSRPDTFWYAPVGEIFAYEDAVNAARLGESEIENVSDLTLYAIVNGERITIAPHSTVAV